LRPANPPGLAAIAYRIGTFTSFRRAMLDRVALRDLLAPFDNPFLSWREGADSDYQTLFVELWAYLADVLTFYQERIANEAFLGTATQRDSLLRLVRLTDFHPSPGAGAIGSVAFTVEKDKTINVPAGFRVGSKAQPPNPAAVFETVKSAAAAAANNAIPLSAVAPRDQFANLNSPQTIVVRTVVLQGVSNRLSAGDYVLAVANRGSASDEQAHPFQLTGVSTDRKANTTTITWEEPAGLAYDQSTKLVELYALRVTTGVFGNVAPAFNTLSAALNGIVTIVDADGHTTSITGPLEGKNWDDLDHDWAYLPTPTIPAISAVAAIPASPAKPGPPAIPATPGIPAIPASPAIDSDPREIFLDAVRDGIAASPQRPNWAVLTSDSSQMVFHIIEARTATKAAYTLSSKATRLTIADTESLPDKNAKNTLRFPIRTTIVRTGAEPLKLQNNLPLPDPVSGNGIILSGLQPQLASGQTVMFQGTVFGSDVGGAKPVVNAEMRTLKSAPVTDTVNNITTVTLNKSLDKLYNRAGAVLMANIAEVTQGETVRREVVGSGEGAAFQTLALKKSPLTYLASSDAEGLSAAASTLILAVNGIRWAEVPSLLETSADAQVYSLSQDDAGQTSLLFGDGFNGARPPSGQDNIVARYRKGLGTSGNLAAGSVQQMLDNIAGLQKAVNPQPTGGGADPDNISQIRRNAPASLRTFGRIVSIADFAGMALSFPGIAKASAVRVTRDAQLRAVANPYVQLTVATSDQTPLARQPILAGRLRAYLDQRRDPNVPLRIVDFSEVFLDLTASVDIDNRFPRLATLAAVRAAVNPGVNPDQTAGFFAFERLDFGEAIHLSAVYAALQAVPGVIDATVTLFRRLDLDAGNPNEIRDHVFIRPTEVAAIRNDPGNPSTGTLTINLGSGGFTDS